jgi:hypothetical protein
LIESWSDRLLTPLIPNPSKLHFEQEVLPVDLQIFDYDLGNMNTPYPNIGEDMEFTKVLIVKQKLEKLSMEAELYSSGWTLKTNTC